MSEIYLCPKCYWDISDGPGDAANHSFECEYLKIIKVNIVENAIERAFEKRDW